MFEAKIVPKIVQGMRSALYDAKTLSEDFSAVANTEYLITVNIAKKISELGPLLGSDPIVTRLEYSTKRFATSCVPLMKRIKRSNGRSPYYILRQSKNASRNGRIDITVEELSNGLAAKPVCAIEVKAFNQSRKSTLEDLRRNAEYFDLQCATGRSNIEFTAFCAFHSFGSITLVADKSKELEKVRAIYDEYMKSVQLLPTIEYELHPFTASDLLMTGEESDEDYNSISHEIHHHIGMVVIFRWKPEDIKSVLHS
jgi:hypothetical protein